MCDLIIITCDIKLAMDSTIELLPEGLQEITLSFVSLEDRPAAHLVSHKWYKILETKIVPIRSKCDYIALCKEGDYLSIARTPCHFRFDIYEAYRYGHLDLVKLFERLELSDHDLELVAAHNRLLHTGDDSVYNHVIRANGSLFCRDVPSDFIGYCKYNYPELITTVTNEQLKDGLEIACDMLSVDVIKLLLAKGATPTMRTAVILDDVTTLKRLYVSTPVTPFWVLNDAFFDAIKCGNEAAVHYLTPLVTADTIYYGIYRAFSRDYTHIGQYLLKYAPVLEKGYKAALGGVCFCGSLTGLELILPFGPFDWNESLTKACMFNDPFMAQRMIELGATKCYFCNDLESHKNISQALPILLQDK